VLFPESSAVAEGWHAAFGAHACAAEDHQCLFHGLRGVMGEKGLCGFLRDSGTDDPFQQLVFTWNDRLWKGK
jgi:hypothetical protein